MDAKLTRLREEILRVVNDAENPLSVKQIKNRIQAYPNLSSIYRALDFLSEKNLVHSLSFSGMAYYFTGKKGSGHFLICKGCNEMIEFEDCVADGLQKKIQKMYDYVITDHILFFEGFCTECRTHFSKKERVMK